MNSDGPSAEIPRCPSDALEPATGAAYLRRRRVFLIPRMHKRWQVALDTCSLRDAVHGRQQPIYWGECIRSTTLYLKRCRWMLVGDSIDTH